MKVMHRVKRFFLPLKYTSIMKNLNSKSEIELQNDIYKSISRLAFEKDVKKQIHVIQLDYNSLES